MPRKKRSTVGSAGSATNAQPTPGLAVSVEQLEELRLAVDRQRAYAELQRERDRIIDGLEWQFVLTWHSLFDGTTTDDGKGGARLACAAGFPSSEMVKNLLREGVPLDLLRKAAGAVHRSWLTGAVTADRTQRYFLGCVRNLREEAAAEAAAAAGVAPDRALAPSAPARHEVVVICPDDETLGRMILDPRTAREGVSRLSSEDFRTSQQRVIFQAIKRCIDDDGVVDVLGVVRELERLDSADEEPDGATWRERIRDLVAGA